MNNSDFWVSVNSIVQNGFTPDGLRNLDRYAELFINGQLVYKRFSPREQHGCAAGGSDHVIATLLAAAEDRADKEIPAVGGFKEEVQRGARQAAIIEQWAKVAGIWTDDVDLFLNASLGEEIAEGGEAKVYDHGATLIKSIGLDYFLLPILALDRVSLHNTYFPETALTVVGFGRNTQGDFKMIVEQSFIAGVQPTDEEIDTYMSNMGFVLCNPHNWTYATPDVYLSDLHDENVIKSASGNIFVVDCDIRINTPELHQGGKRSLSTEVTFPQPPSV